MTPLALRGTVFPMPLTQGTRLGPYEILSPLGAGGMGEVYRARDTRLGRDIALKLLPADLAGAPDRLARFEREARMVAGLNHPNIVMLHSVEEHGGANFLTMELVDGRNLAELVTPDGLPLAKVLELAVALADALVAAHEKGVVHRDLKPANVMLTREGRLKVLDFGLAKHLDRDIELTRTSDSLISEVGQVLGTMPYMAPEQIRGETVDARSDLFSFGVVVYELLSGKRPFGGQTSADVSSAILRDTPPPLPSIPPDLARILERCLQKNPRERFQTALDVGNELRRVVRGAPSAAPKPAGDEASVAVLPFANRSASADDEYFADGLADELLATLARIRGLRVAARTSSSQFKGTKDDLATIGKKLNVASLLEGSVRKAGNRVRITVQLINVSDGYRVWSESYDRTLDDVFAVQDDIAQSVVKELRHTLLGEADDSDASRAVRAEVAHAARGRSTNPEAQRLLLQARYLDGLWTPEGQARAIEDLKQALALDPEFASAWAELAHHHARKCALGNGLEERRLEAARAHEAIEHALALGPDLVEAHAILGWICLSIDLDWKRADLALRRALELEPTHPVTLRLASTVARTGGDFARAEVLLRQAAELDPLSGAPFHNLGILLQLVGRDAEAVEAFETGLVLMPHLPGSRGLRSVSLFAIGRKDDAFAEAAREPSPVGRLWALGTLCMWQGQTVESDRHLAELIEGYPVDAAYQIASLYGRRGDVEESFRWLERARVELDAGMMETRNAPEFRFLHDDPRWAALMRALHFE